MKTELSDRELFYDGTSRVQPGLVPELFLRGVPPEKIVVTELNDDIKLFNQLSEVSLDTSSPAVVPDLTWQLPPAWAELDLEGYFAERLKGYDERYRARALAELAEVRRRGLEMLIRALIYVVHALTANRQVWGVGRGSSCASLLLFLIGLHRVDPIKYDIPLDEFFHD